MTLKRIGALLAAVALVVGALLLRDAIDDDAGEASDNTNEPTSDNGYSLLCSTEFAAICSAIDGDVSVMIESAGTTLARLARPDADLPDAWLTLDPFPGMLDDLRSLGGSTLPRVVDRSEIIAVTDPALAMKLARLDSFNVGCSDQPPWRCAADHANDPWTDLDPEAESGSIEIGIRDPGVEAIGLLDLANAVAGHYGSADLDQRPWDTDPEFVRWLRVFAKDVIVVQPPSTPLNTMLTRPAVNVASSTAAEAEANPQFMTTFDLVTVTPEVPVNAALATIGDDNDELAAQLSSALSEVHWSVPPAGETPLTPSTFIALRQQWEASS